MDVHRPCQSSQRGKVIKQVACPADPATMHGVGARIVRTALRGDFGVTTKSSFPRNAHEPDVARWAAGARRLLLVASNLHLAPNSGAVWRPSSLTHTPLAALIVGAGAGSMLPISGHIN